MCGFSLNPTTVVVESLFACQIMADSQDRLLQRFCRKLALAFTIAVANAIVPHGAGKKAMNFQVLIVPYASVNAPNTCADVWLRCKIYDLHLPIKFAEDCTHSEVHALSLLGLGVMSGFIPLCKNKSPPWHPTA